MDMPTTQPKRNPVMKQHHPRTLTAIWAALPMALIAALAPVHADDGVKFDVRSNLPVSCEASIVASTLVTITPLLINATVRRVCNTKHDLAVSYPPLSVSQPTRLSITFDGAAPNVKLPGSQIFTNLPHTNSIKSLTIRYSGGTLGQRQELARSWKITVTPH
jgi:hypothetical protein